METIETIKNHFTLEEIANFIVAAFKKTISEKTFKNNFFNACSFSEDTVCLRPKPNLQFDCNELKCLLEGLFPAGSSIFVVRFLIKIKLPSMEDIAKKIEFAFHEADAENYCEDICLSAIKIEKGVFQISLKDIIPYNKEKIHEELVKRFPAEKYKLTIADNIHIYKKSFL